MQMMSDTCLYSGRCYSTMHPRLKMKLIGTVLEKECRKKQLESIANHIIIKAGEVTISDLLNRLSWYIAGEVCETGLFAGEAKLKSAVSVKLSFWIPVIHVSKMTLLYGNWKSNTAPTCRLPF